MRLVQLASIAITGLTTLSLVACGGGGSGDDDDDDTSPDADVTVPPDADNADFTTLIARAWTIPTGEHYRCVRILVEEDVYIQTFRAQAPLGTHHTVLSVSDSGTPGEYNCSAGSLDSEMLYASGVGTDDLQFPEGVAIRVAAGRYLNLNLHLFNTSPGSEMSGTSGILVRAIPAAQVTQQAEMLFAGTVFIAIPGNTPENNLYSTGGGCTFNQPFTLHAYWPHMHQHARHQTVTLTHNGAANVIHDEAFAFEEQRNYVPTTPIQVAAGDSIETECFYANSGGSTVTFGDSSTSEMCFTGIYRYPAIGGSIFSCVEGGGAL